MLLIVQKMLVVFVDYLGQEFIVQFFTVWDFAAQDFTAQFICLGIA
jgi:hypothetical protein